MLKAFALDLVSIAMVWLAIIAVTGIENAVPKLIAAWLLMCALYVSRKACKAEEEAQE